MARESRLLALSRLRRPEASVLLLTGLSLLLQGVTALFTARWLGASERGVLVIAISTSGLVTLIGSAGLLTSVRTLLAHERYELTFPAFVPLASRLIIAAGIPLVVVGTIIVSLVGGVDDAATVVAFAAFAVTGLAGALGRESLHGLGRHRSAVLSDLFPPILQLSGATVLWQAGHLTVFAVLLLGGVGNALQIAFTLWRGQYHRAARRSGSWQRLRSLVVQSLPALAMGLGNAVMWKGDRIILGAARSNADVGIYGTAASLADLAWVVPAAASAMLTRRVSQEHSLRSLPRWRRYFVGLTAAFSVGAAGVAFLVLRFFLGGEFVRGLPVAYLLCGAAVLLASSNIDLAACQGMGDFRSGSLTSAVGAGVLVLFATPLSIAFGALGCAVASLVAYATTAGMARWRVSTLVVRTTTATAPFGVHP